MCFCFYFFIRLKLLKYIPLQLVFLLIIGIVIGFYFPFTPKIINITIAIGLLILIITYFLSNKKLGLQVYFTIGTYIVFIIIGIASITYNKSILKKDHYSIHLAPAGNTSTLIIDEILKPNAYQNRYFANVVSLNSKIVQGKILLNISKDSGDNKLKVDDKIFVTHSFNTIKTPLNPYQFNYKKYLNKQQVHHQISTRNKEFLLLKNDTYSLRGLAFSIRSEINKALIEHNFSGDELAIINALLLGQRQEISKNIMQNYQNAGAVHILAVSGLHVGIILLILTFLLKPIEKLKHGKFIKLFLIVLLLWVFAFIAGLSASIIRAVTMFTAVAISLAINQPFSTYKALIISIFVLLLFDPFYLFNVGFQLSYLAVFFIIWTQPMLYKLWKPSFKLVDYFWRLLTVSLAAQIGVLPLSLYYFHQFPGLFFLTNLIIIPVLGIILGFGILVIVLALIKILPDIIIELYNKVISMLNSVVEWIATKESFLFQNISFSEISIVIYFLLVISFFKWIEIKKLSYLKISLIAIIIFQVNLIVEKQISSTTKEFIVFNKTRQSILGNRTGQNLQLTHTLADTIDIKKENFLKSYLIGSETKLTSVNNSLKNIYPVHNKYLLVIDSLGIYNSQNYSSNYILLIQSPKINLDRLIQNLNPEIIIADASNYKNYISHWKKTCKNNNIKFHYTVTDGAFIEKI